MFLISLVVNIVSMIVAVVCTLTVIRDLEESYGGESVATSRKKMHNRC